MCSKPLRILCIVQLCIGFSLLLYALCAPTLGRHYEDNRKLLIVESALGDTSGIAWKWANAQEKESLKRNKLLAEHISPHEKEALHKIKDSLVKSVENRALFAYTFTWLLHNPYFLLYIAASIFVPLFILLKFPKEIALSLFLPIIGAAFVFDNALFAIKHKTQEEALFPTENELCLVKDETEIEDKLDAWLIQKYLHTLPSHDPLVLKNQKEEASYHFLVARALTQKTTLNEPVMESKKDKGLLMLFLCWNIFFPLISYRSKNLNTSLTIT